MGSHVKTSVLVSFLLLLPALVYCDDIYLQLEIFTDKNCTDLSITYTSRDDPNTTFPVSGGFNVSQTMQSAILTNYVGGLVSLVACQVGFQCNDPAAIQISFNLTDLGACSTAGPPGTEFDRFLQS